MKGRVKFFNKMKGFGFVTGEDGKDYFVHQSDVAEGTLLRENDSVSFTPAQSDRGMKAEKVSLAQGDNSEDSEEEFEDNADEDAEEGEEDSGEEEE